MTLSQEKPLPRRLGGTERVAAILLSLDKAVARRVLKHFDQVELRRIAKVAGSLGVVSASTLEELAEDLIGQLSADGADLIGTLGQTEELLTGVVPHEQVAEIMSDLLGKPNDHFWRKLSALSEANLASYLSSEHPQTVAVVASKLDSPAAARFLELLPASLRNDVIRRLLTSGPVSDLALRLLEATLQDGLMQPALTNSSPQVDVKVAAIMNQMDRDHIDDVLESVSQTDPAIVERLRGRLFTFENIPRLSARARSILLDQVPVERLILALRGADFALREAMLPALSARMRRMVESELSGGDTPPGRDIVKAQREIAETVLKLAETGAIDLTAENDGANF